MVAPRSSSAIGTSPAGVRAQVASAVHRFAKGITLGLSAPALLMFGGIQGPKAPSDGIAEDWKKIGNDIRNVAEKHAR